MTGSYFNAHCYVLKQRWARAYRDNEFHAAVDTNNGTKQSAEIQVHAKTES